MKYIVSLIIIFGLFACQTNPDKKKETKASNEWVSLRPRQFDLYHRQDRI